MDREELIALLELFRRQLTQERLEQNVDAIIDFMQLLRELLQEIMAHVTDQERQQQIAQLIRQIEILTSLSHEELRDQFDTIKNVFQDTQQVLTNIEDLPESLNERFDELTQRLEELSHAIKYEMPRYAAVNLPALGERYLGHYWTNIRRYILTGDERYLAFLRDLPENIRNYVHEAFRRLNRWIFPGLFTTYNLQRTLEYVLGERLPFRFGGEWERYMRLRQNILTGMWQILRHSIPRIDEALRRTGLMEPTVQALMRYDYTTAARYVRQAMQEAFGMEYEQQEIRQILSEFMTMIRSLEDRGYLTAFYAIPPRRPEPRVTYLREANRLREFLRETERTQEYLRRISGQRVQLASRRESRIDASGILRWVNERLEMLSYRVERTFNRIAQIREVMRQTGFETVARVLMQIGKQYVGPVAHVGEGLLSWLMSVISQLARFIKLK